MLAEGKVNLFDLTGAQVATVEEAIGLPYERWQEAHKGKLFPLILHIALGGELAEYEAMSMRQLARAIVVEDSEGKDESAAR